MRIKIIVFLGKRLGDRKSEERGSSVENKKGKFKCPEELAHLASQFKGRTGVDE